MNIEIPERVAFVNIKTGNVFFDCHPAEARTAMNAVKKLRLIKQNPDLLLEESTLNKQKEAILNDKTQPEIYTHSAPAWTATSIITVVLLNSIFARIEQEDYKVTAMFMNSIRFADIRNFGKAIYDEYDWDIDLQDWKNDMRIEGRLWGALIVVCNQLTNEDLFFTSMFKNGKLLDAPYVKKCQLAGGE